MIALPATIPLPLRMDNDGTIRVGRSRVTLDTIITAHKQGDSPEKIQQDFDAVKLDDVYAVITYYLQHTEDVDAYLRKRKEEAEELRRTMEAEHPEIFVLQNKFRAILAEKRAQEHE
jgi:uncharacterized protein (DUF433 family)